jgi:hypothetical protein
MSQLVHFQILMSVTERQILRDAVNVRRSEDLGFPHGSTPFGALAHHQMALAGTAEKHLAGACYLKSFGH